MVTVASLFSASISFLHGAARGERVQSVPAASDTAGQAGSRNERVPAASHYACAVQADACAEGVELFATEARQDGTVRR